MTHVNTVFIPCLTCKHFFDNCTALRFKYCGIYTCNKNQKKYTLFTSMNELTVVSSTCFEHPNGHSQFYGISVMHPHK